MVFSSLLFLYAFLAALLAVYFFPLFRRRITLRNWILLLFSLLFYCCGGLRFLPVILLSILGSYLFGRLVGGHAPPRRKKLYAGLSVGFHVGILVVFKYLGFLTENLHRLIPQLPVAQLVLPIGISFYTFQGLSYILDVYRGEVPAERSLASVALYISLFPQLIAGPIVRYQTVAEELHERSTSSQDAALGVQRFLFGLGKKVLLANPMGALADQVFGHSGDTLGGALAWLGLLAYTAQIYFDFSGYSDMAIGLGRLFGFHFPENFRYPYAAQSVRDFWKRWHITLSTWFRDYVYIPLGGSRCSKARHIRNFALVWLLTGLWHGAAWNYILWGVYYGALLLGERYLWGRAWERLPRPFRHILTLLLVMLGWLLFRGTGLGQIAAFLRAMVGLSPAGFGGGEAVFLLRQYLPELLCAVLFSLPLLPGVKSALTRSGRKGLSYRLFDHWALPLFSLLVGCLSVMQLVRSGFNPFLYYQF